MKNRCVSREKAQRQALGGAGIHDAMYDHLVGAYLGNHALLFYLGYTRNLPMEGSREGGRPATRNFRDVLYMYSIQYAYLHRVEIYRIILHFNGQILYLDTPSVTPLGDKGLDILG